MTARGLAGTLCAVLAAGCLSTIPSVPLAIADAGEDHYISDHLVPRDWGSGRPEVMAHPLNRCGLLKMGHQACSDIANGVSPDFERDKLQTSLMNQGVAASRADVGTLVHFALRDLCPNVPTPPVSDLDSKGCANQAVTQWRYMHCTRWLIANFYLGSTGGGGSLPQRRWER
jgi:hypothetical protein